MDSVLDCEKDADRNTAEASKTSKNPNEESSGTGIIVSTSGHILTNNHVVENCGQIEVSRPSEAPTLARKSAADARNDLALLTSDLGNTKVPPFRASARLGEEIFVFGFPLSGLLSKSGNFTSGAITALFGLEEDATKYQISAPVQPGNSGGPLLDKYGNIAGVIVSKLNSSNVAQVTGDIPQNVNFAIKSVVAMNFLESNGIRLPSGTTGAALEPADVAELANRYAVYIVCRSGQAYANSSVQKSSKSASLDSTASWEGIWAKSVGECLNPNAGSSRTLIDLRNGEYGPTFDRYDRHCRISRHSTNFETVRMSLTCFKSKNDYIQRSGGRTEEVILIPTVSKDLLINGDRYLRCEKRE